jgi:isoleucyl-tRNA synthetase
MMRRVTDVLDCWFESGAMPFAQLHYPFENKEWFEDHFPADFICEYVGQTRGWFYTLHVLSSALFDRPAFSNCLAHGNVLGDDGRKLSKRLQNFPDPEEFFGKAGADTMRWFMLSSPVLRGLDVAMENDAMAEPIRKVLNPIWNSWYFLCLYAGTDGVIGHERVDQTGLLDRYILAKSAALVDEVTAALDRYDLSTASNAVTGFLDALTNWYVRRSRDRFWRPFGESESADSDKIDAYDTLHTVLELLCRVVAPLVPYLAEEVWRPLTGGRSVHLADWPSIAALPANPDLVQSMDLVREICSAAHSIRKANGLRARLPLRSLTFAGQGTAGLTELAGLIAEEVNVKEVRFSEDLAAFSEERLSLIPAALGPRLGPRTQEVIGSVKRGDWTLDSNGIVVAGAIPLEAGEYELLAVPSDEQSSRVLSGGEGVVVLDCVPDTELEAEGTARDVVRNVQTARKRAELHVSDRIQLSLTLPEEVAEVVDGHLEWIAAQTLAIEIELIIGVPSSSTYELSDGAPIGIDLKKI